MVYGIYKYDVYGVGVCMTKIIIFAFLRGGENKNTNFKIYKKKKCARDA
jgi:hypothetical protein